MTVKYGRTDNVGHTLCNIYFEEKNYEKNLFVVVQNCVPHLIIKFQLVKLTGCLSSQSDIETFVRPT